jgi:hypothetical protein
MKIKRKAHEGNTKEEKNEILRRLEMKYPGNFSEI